VIDSQRGPKRRVGYSHLISNKREWNNCFIKNHQQILLDFADFAWLEQPQGNLMDAISRVWYNGSYTIAATPIKIALYNDPVFNKGNDTHVECVAIEIFFSVRIIDQTCQSFS